MIGPGPMVNPRPGDRECEGSDKGLKPLLCGRAAKGEGVGERGREVVRLPLGLLDTHGFKLQPHSCCPPAALHDLTILHAKMPYIREHKEVRRVTVPRKASDKEPMRFLNPIWIFWMHDEKEVPLDDGRKWGMAKIWCRRDRSGDLASVWGRKGP